MSSAASGNGSSNSWPRPGRVGCLSIWTRGYGSTAGAIRRSWRPASLATAAGFAQSSATSALADVARSFREPSPRSAPATGGSCIAAAVVALPLPVCPLYARLPETLGVQLDESAPD
jgi:hypothetical protein